MGRPRLSLQSHVLRGTRPHYDPSKDAPAPAIASGRPKVPSHLNGAARSEFKRICQLLEKRQHLTAGDLYAAAALAEIVTRWVRAKRELDERGLMIRVEWTDKNGDLRSSEKLSPLVNAVAAMESAILRYSRALGLSPIDRSKVVAAAVPPPAPDDEEAAFAAFEKQLEQGATNAN